MYIKYLAHSEMPNSEPHVPNKLIRINDMGRSDDNISFEKRRQLVGDSYLVVRYTSNSKDNISGPIPHLQIL
jgi:hypothetical protein